LNPHLKIQKKKIQKQYFEKKKRRGIFKNSKQKRNFQSLSSIMTLYAKMVYDLFLSSWIRPSPLEWLSLFCFFIFSGCDPLQGTGHRIYLNQI